MSKKKPPVQELLPKHFSYEIEAANNFIPVMAVLSDLMRDPNMEIGLALNYHTFHISLGGFYKHGAVDLSMSMNGKAIVVRGRYGDLEEIEFNGGDLGSRYPYIVERLIHINYQEYLRYKDRGFDLSPAWKPYHIALGNIPSEPFVYRNDEKNFCAEIECLSIGRTTPRIEASRDRWNEVFRDIPEKLRWEAANLAAHNWDVIMFNGRILVCGASQGNFYHTDGTLEVCSEDILSALYDNGRYSNKRLFI